MTYKQLPVRILGLTLLLFACLLAGALCVAFHRPVYLLLVVPAVVWTVAAILRFQARTRVELEQFLEAVRYRDFSRQFDVKRAPAAVQPLRHTFNEIGAAFRQMAKERETQHLYLQKILELVDTGILTYDLETGDVLWMNEAVRRLLQLPYLRNISALARRDAHLHETLASLMAGESRVVATQTGNNQLRLLLTATGFAVEGKRFKLIAFQNAGELIDEAESKAWQKLLSVLTHEIMNSIAPIASLAETMKGRLALRDDSIFEDLELGIDTIRRRSESLLQFADTYRQFNRITSADRRPVFVRELFGNLHLLMQPGFEQKGVDLETLLRDPSLQFEGDAALIEQVLINLLVNALEAVRERPEPKVVLSAEASAGKVVLRVADNGVGIPAELLEQIFVPFFSTRKNGSGIGLSLCKQIVLLHKGTIQVQSVAGQGTVFLVTLDAVV